jgi:ribonucleoside-diphosphate reductase alpha chain
MTVTEAPGRTSMQVRKRNGDSEPVDVNKIVRAVDRVSADLADVDPMRVATRTISGLYDGATTAELDRLSIQTAAEMIGEEPQYSRLAARLLSGYIDKEARNQGVMSFSQSVALGHAEGLIGDETARFVKDNARKLDFAIDDDADRRFEYFGLRTVYDRYLLRHPSSRLVVETPQYFLLRVASGLAQSPGEAIRFYRLMSRWPTCRRRRRCSTPAPGTRRCRRATSWTRRSTTSTRSTRATRRWRSCRSSPAASASRSRGSARAAR